MKTFIKGALFLIAGLFIQTQLFATTTNENIREINVKGTDNMKFDVTLIEASPGETIRITLTTESNMPKQAMAHNIAIVGKDVDLDEFVMASITAQDNDYIAPDYEDRILAHTDMIGGGESSTIEFKVPEEPGDYTYVCTFPGHYQGGMTGILRVQ